MTRRFFRPDSKTQERASRSLRESMEKRKVTQCPSIQSGLRCMGTTGHEKPHWCWMLDRMLQWED